MDLKIFTSLVFTLGLFLISIFGGIFESINDFMARESRQELIQNQIILEAKLEQAEKELHIINSYLTFDDEEEQLKAKIYELLGDTDPMSLSDYQRIFVKNIAELILYASANGLGLTFGEARRTIEQQRIYVREGKSQTLNSNHLKALAIDFNVFEWDGEDWELTWSWNKIKTLGDYWVTLDLNNRWGGDWNRNGIRDGWIDAPHFEMNIK